MEIYVQLDCNLDHRRVFQAHRKPMSDAISSHWRPPGRRRRRMRITITTANPTSYNDSVANTINIPRVTQPPSSQSVRSLRKRQPWRISWPMGLWACLLIGSLYGPLCFAHEETLGTTVKLQTSDSTVTPPTLTSPAAHRNNRSSSSNSTQIKFDNSEWIPITETSTDQIELTRKNPSAFGAKVASSSTPSTQLIFNEPDLLGSSSTSRFSSAILSAVTTTKATTTYKKPTPSLVAETDLESELEITTAKFESGKIDTTNLPSEDFGEDSPTALRADLDLKEDSKGGVEAEEKVEGTNDEGSTISRAPKAFSAAIEQTNDNGDEENEGPLFGRRIKSSYSPSPSGRVTAVNLRTWKETSTLDLDNRQRKIQPSVLRERKIFLGAQNTNRNSPIGTRRKLNDEDNRRARNRLGELPKLPTNTEDEEEAKELIDGDDDLEAKTESNKAVIRLVSTVSPKPFIQGESKDTTASLSAKSESSSTTSTTASTTTTTVPTTLSTITSSDASVEASRKLPTISIVSGSLIGGRRHSTTLKTTITAADVVEGQKSIGYGKKRTVIRRLPIWSKPTNEPSTNSTATFKREGGQVEKMKTRMRLKDSSIGHIQSKFRANPPNPTVGSSAETPGSAAPSAVILKDLKMLRRNRMRSRITTPRPPTIPLSNEPERVPRRPLEIQTSEGLEVTTWSTTTPTYSSTPTTPFTTIAASITTTRTTRNPTTRTTSTTTATTEATISVPSSPSTINVTTTIPIVITTTTSSTSTTSEAELSTKKVTSSSPVTKSNKFGRGDFIFEPNVTISSGELNTSESKNDQEGQENESDLERRDGIAKIDSQRPGSIREDLMAAIRRKISEKRISSLTDQLGSDSSNGNSERIPVTKAKAYERDANLVRSTELPDIFRPIQNPDTTSLRSDANFKVPQKPRVQFFLRLPNRKPGSAPEKITHLSHIQGKLARLNAAITEGLANERREQELARRRERFKAKRIQEAAEYESETSSNTFVKSNSNVVLSIGQPNPIEENNTPSPTPRSRVSSLTTSSPIESKSSPGSISRVILPPMERAHYLDVLRERTRAKIAEETTSTSIDSTTGTPETTMAMIKTSTTAPTTTSSTTATTTTTIITTTTSKYVSPITTSTQKPKRTTAQSVKTTATTTMSPVPVTTQKIFEIPPVVAEEHPSSHFRPQEAVESNESTPSNNSDEGMMVYANSNSTATVGESSSEAMMNDITGTTIYVVCVLLIIPLAGLVAWGIRYAVRKKDFSNLESGSETGLNCPINDEDMLQINHGKTNPALNNNNNRTTNVDDFDDDEIVSNGETSQLDHAEVSEILMKGPWQYDRENLRLLTVLGEGNFGKVWKAEADNICGYEGTILVAVKTAKEGAPQKEVGDLLQEMKIMQTIGPHPNVVTLLGIAVELEPYLLIMEYVMYGKLLQHLRDQRSKQTNFFQFSSADQGVDDLGTLQAKDLTKYAYGVAKGMEYIVSKGIIHRDLAARNILIDHKKVCKISDFGLSRNLSDTGSEMYEQKTKGALPIRWMAPESLYFSVFTPKSDVWSFGILMWEIVTLGSTPYPGMGAREVMRRVRDGYRLERPSHCHPDLYKIIAKCWSGDMNKRPDFTELRQELAKLLEDQHGYIDLQNIPENKYYSMTQNSNEEEKL